MHPASEDDDSPKSVSCVTKDNDFTCSSNKQRERSHSTSSSTSSTSSISSLFESSLALLGSLPVATSLSSSGKPIIHLSKQNGNFKLYLNSSIENFNEIQLQSHLLWPSSPRLAELMEDEEAKTKDGEIGIKGERVLELGAGSALVSLLAARMGASHVEITDYPAPGIMEAIRRNVQANLTPEEQSRVSVSPLDWTDESALQGMMKKHPKGFTRILAADTLWMGHLNASQLKVMTSLLSTNCQARIIIVAGLHTGRHVIRSFLSMAVQAGLEIERAEELDRRAEGEKGIDWKSVMENADGEDETEIYEGIEEERRRWLVYTRLKWPTPGGETEMLDRTEEFALATSRVSSHVTCTASAISGA